MGLIKINKNPSRRQLLVFGGLWVVFFCILGGIVLRKTHWMPAAAAVWTLAVAVPVVGSLVPGAMRIVYLGMTYAAFPVGFVLSHVILAAVYYLVLTPTGLLMRLFGYDPMHRRFDPHAPTYWVPRDEEHDVGRYFRQF
jgi:hypothetical protein